MSNGKSKPSQPAIPGFSFRPLQPSDADGLIDIFLASAAFDQTTPPDQARLVGLIKQQKKLLMTNTLAAEAEDGNLAGVTFFLLQSAGQGYSVLIDGVVAPKYRHQGLGTALMDWLLAQVEAQANGKPALLRVVVEDHLKAKNILFDKAGFECRIRQYTMEIDLESFTEELFFPQGFHLEPYHKKHQEAMFQVFNLAFADHWAGNQTLESFTNRFVETSQFNPELTWLVFEGKSLAGYYLSENQTDQPEQAWLEVMAVHPDWQGKGLGSALLSDALHRYQTAGYQSAALDVEPNASARALQMYEKFGYKKQVGMNYYFKRIEGEVQV